MEPAPGGSWYYGSGTEPKGPFTRHQMEGLVQAGTIGPATLVWTSSMPDWLPLGQSQLRQPALASGPSSAAGPGPAIAPAEMRSSETALRHFIGKNADYYLAKWSRMDEKNSKISFNWAAFIFGFSWVAYRKMYTYAALFIVIVGLETFLEYILDFSENASRAITVVIACYFGFFGNYIYKLHAETKTNEIVGQRLWNEARIELSRQGGTSFVAAIGFVLALVVVILFVAAVAERVLQ